MAKEVWMWLAAGLGYGAVNTGELLGAYPEGAQAIADDLGSSRLDELLTQKQAERLASTRPEDFSLRLAHAEALGIHALPFSDKDYPDMLRSIATPPPMLFVKGDLSLMNGQLSIGMVGARRPSAYGAEAMKAIGRGVALGGAIIVSGLAAGLDAEAHKAALAVNGPTIACIAFGHDQCYPAANKKLMEVIENTGAVVSEYPLGTTAEKPYFLQRNRLIAGLSHGLVVIEARKHSGTMSTVNFATEYGRDVFAVPGSIFSELSGGTNAMIREGAFLAGSATDVLAEYGVELAQEDPVVAATKQAAEGRPAAAPAGPTPVWRQNLARKTAQERSAPADTPLDEMTLAEALQGQLGRTGVESGQASSRQAIDAFRRLQQMMPPTDDSELDARNRALDEMVAAVSDNVQLSSGGERRGTRPAPPSGEERVQKFEWSQVEHLSRKDLKQEAKAAKAPPQPAAPVVRQPARGRGPGPGPVEPVGRVDAVPPVAPVSSVLGAGAVVLSEDGTVRQAPPAARPGAQSAAAPPKGEAGTSLASRLRTSRTAPEGASPAVVMDFSAGHAARAAAGTSPAAAPPYTPPAPQAAPTAGAPPEEEDDGTLSDAAQRTLRQLGPHPVTLTQICERSGLSPGEAMAALTELELAGLSRQLAGRQFVIMQ